MNYLGLKVQHTNARMFFVPNCINAIEEQREEIQKARDIAKKMLEKYDIINSNNRLCVTV